MSEVLVVVDHVDAAVTKPTLELLTIARRLGEPSAVYFGGGDIPPVLSEYGAEKVYQLEDAAYDEFLVGPKAEAIAKLVADTSPAAVLIASSAEGKEIGARVALKSESGFISDAVDVEAADGGAVTTQSVFAGNFTVRAVVTKGVPVITVKPNSTTPEVVSGAGAVEPVKVEITDAAKSARITES